MGKILAALASGKLATLPVGDPQIEGFQEIKKELIERYEDLSDILNDDQNQLLKNLVKVQDKEHYLYSNDCFIRGYSIGILTMMEVLEGYEDLIQGNE